MNATDQILKTLEKRNEVPFSEIELFAAKSDDHKRFYPLAQLIESEYVGFTRDLSSAGPKGTEKMKEFTISTHLHMNTLKPNSEGTVKYENISMRGELDKTFERFFLKSKGFLYLADKAQRKNERIFSVIISIIAGVLVGVVATQLNNII